MQRTKQNITNKLSSWLLWRPLQFTCIILGITILLSLAYGLVMGWLAPESDMMWPLWTLICMTFIGTIIWLGKKLPADNLDRHSFVSIYTATNILMFVLYLATILGALAIVQKLLTSATLGFGTMLTLGGILVIGVFSIALAITELFALYRRVRTMGVSRRTALWCIPFGLCLLAAPAYIMPDSTRKRTTATDSGNGKWTQIINWIVTRRGAALSLMTLGLIISTLTMGVNNSASIGWLGLALFGLWYVITRHTSKRTIAGRYSVFMAVLNVIMVITAIAAITYSTLQTPQYDVAVSAETVEITQQ